MAGLYIHIPFCKQACHYCDFHFSTSLAYKPQMIAAISKEIELKSQFIKNKISTIYFGGGTPSLLSSAELDLLIRAIHHNYKLDEDLEITIEVNPDDVTTDFISMLKDSVVNRISMGIQSFFQEDLEYMNRAHNAQEARTALEACLASGFNNMTADLIYGVPTLSNKRWEENIDTLIQYNIPHLSCYQLTVEDKTPLEAYIDRGSMQAPSDESGVEHFNILLDKMDRHGYEDYEISNYAKPGFRSRHNSAYWKGESYLGFGPSAHSYIDNTRSWNTVVNNRYMEFIADGKLAEESEVLTDENRYNEFVLTRLRTMEGIPLFEIEKRFPKYVAHFKSCIPQHIQKVHIKESHDHIILTREGKVWADAISGSMMA